MGTLGASRALQPHTVAAGSSAAMEQGLAMDTAGGSRALQSHTVDSGSSATGQGPEVHAFDESLEMPT
eukprot:8152441-Lingulodinium_polyedra.AAC.1